MPYFRQGNSLKENKLFLSVYYFTSLPQQPMWYLVRFWHSSAQKLQTVPDLNSLKFFQGPARTYVIPTTLPTHFLQPFLLFYHIPATLAAWLFTEHASHTPTLAICLCCSFHLWRQFVQKSSSWLVPSPASDLYWTAISCGALCPFYLKP
jgi:hypothetical protein